MNKEHNVPDAVIKAIKDMVSEKTRTLEWLLEKDNKWEKWFQIELCRLLMEDNYVTDIEYCIDVDKRTNSKNSARNQIDIVYRKKRRDALKTAVELKVSGDIREGFYRCLGDVNKNKDCTASQIERERITNFCYVLLYKTNKNTSERQTKKLLMIKTFLDAENENGYYWMKESLTPGLEMVAVCWNKRKDGDFKVWHRGLIGEFDKLKKTLAK